MSNGKKRSNFISEFPKTFSTLSFGAKFILLTPIIFLLVFSFTVAMGKSHETLYQKFLSAKNYIKSSTSGSPLSVYTLSPSSVNVKKGEIFDVKVKMDTRGEKINATEVTLYYPATSLNVANVSIDENNFDVKVINSYGGGQIHIVAGTIKPRSGILDVATITFKTKSIGQPTIAFISPSLVMSSTTNKNVLYSMISGKYYIR